MTSLLAGLQLQLWWVRTRTDELQAYVITPLFTLLFGAIVTSRGRPDLLPGAVLGAALIGMWMVCTQVGGNIIRHARASGTFEVVASAPSAVPLVIGGRVGIVVAMTLPLLPEAWLTAWALFGVAVPVSHLGLLILALVITLAGLHGAATLVAGLCVLGRRPFVLQLALTYPFYLLSGLVVPVSVLPEWIQPVSRLLFLYWGSDLMRDALVPAEPADVATRLTALTVTSLATMAVGYLVLLVVMRRARVRGTLNLV